MRAQLRFGWLTLLLALAGAGALLEAAPEKWAKDVAALTKKDAAHPAPPDEVVFVGSSSILLWKTLAQDFPGVPVLNHGFGGSELADSVFYFDALVASRHPRLVVLYAGENDIATGKTPEALAGDFRAFCEKFDRSLPDTRLIFIAMKPSPSRRKFIEATKRGNALIAAECARDPRRTFLDIFPLMLDQNGQPRPELFRSDQLHMNAQGYAIWTSALAPLLKR